MQMNSRALSDVAPIAARRHAARNGGVKIPGIPGKIRLAPGSAGMTAPTIRILKEHGLAFCALTKAGPDWTLPYLDLYRPDRDAYAATLTD